MLKNAKKNAKKWNICSKTHSWREIGNQQHRVFEFKTWPNEQGMTLGLSQLSSSSVLILDHQCHEKSDHEEQEWSDADVPASTWEFGFSGKADEILGKVSLVDKYLQSSVICLDLV